MKLGLVDSITTAAMQARKNMLCRAQLNLDQQFDALCTIGDFEKSPTPTNNQQPTTNDIRINVTC